MALTPVRLPTVLDTKDQFQREVRDALKTLDERGVRKLTITGVALTTATTLVAHQLGRKPVGWLVIDKTAQADVWRDATVEVSADKIPLRASASVTVDIQFW